jgi:hypothetical protein
MMGFFLFTTMSRPAQELIEPPIQWALGDLTPEVKQLEHEIDHSSPSSVMIMKIKYACSYTSTPQYIFLA